MLESIRDDVLPLRCATAGSVDDGKSTLIGRLLLDAKALLSDQLAQVEEASRRRGLVRTDLALVTDGLRAEREQGITIDVAWRYFATPRRRFVLADSPGHVEYTRNMVTATSGADVAIILVDARHGLVEQTRRHLFVARLLGVRTICVAMNKMDQVGHSHAVFADVRDAVAGYLAQLPGPGRAPVTSYFPISALHGDNVVAPSTRMPWYDGPTLLAYLESVKTEDERTDAPARFSVQWIVRPQSDDQPDYRGYAGRLASGTLRRGQALTVWPSGRASTLARIETFDGELEEARAGQSVTLHLADALSVSRGDLLTASAEPPPRLTDELVADVAWMHPRPAVVGGRTLIKHGTREVRAVVEAIEHRYDVTTGAPLPPGDAGLGINALGRVRLRTSEPLAVDPYTELRATGSFLLVDAPSGATLAAGMIR